MPVPVAQQPEFISWMLEVDAYLEKRNIGIDDLSCYCYESAWEAGFTPGRAAEDAIANTEIEG